MRFSAATTAERILPARLALAARPVLGQVDAALFGADERGQAGRMSLVAFAIRIVSAVIAFASQVLLARWIGGFEYGIFVLVWTTMIIVGDLSSLGFPTSIVRFIPEYRERGMAAELRGILATSRLSVLVSSSAVAALGAWAIFFFSASIESYYVAPFLVAMIGLPMIALSDMLQGISRANSRPLAALAPAYVMRPLLILAFMGGALALGYEPSAHTAVLAAIAAIYATTLAQIFWITPRFDSEAGSGPMRSPWRTWIVVSLPIFIIEGFYFLLTNADVLIVGYFREPDEVAVYFATVKTLALVHFVYFAVKAGVAQRYAQFSHRDRDQLARFARETVAWTFWPSLLMALGVLAIGRPMLALFGPGFEAGYPLLLPLVFAVVARASVGPAESLLTMSGHQNVCALVYGLTLTVQVALSFWLIPALGLWGAAIAGSAAMIFEAAALSLTVWLKLGIVMALFLPPARRTR